MQGRPPNPNHIANPPARGGRPLGRNRFAEDPVVTTATLAGTLLVPFMDTVPGVIVHVDCDGAPLQVRATFRAKPSMGATARA
jgi:hypothetical protein